MADTDAAAADAGEGRRSSIEKKPIIIPGAGNGLDDINELPAFERLPDEIIQQILQATDANGFASLALLNSKWRSVAQQAHLYAYHLTSCPSYSMSHNVPPQAINDDDLPRLRRLFAREVKRNLFEAYLRPSRTIIKIISNSISSSSSPSGEGIQFSPSPKGHHLLAYNSSRIHVIDLRTPEIAVKREFKILRRPAATCINDEGTKLAVLLTEMEVDIYDLNETPPKRTHSMILDHNPRAIALSPCGSVLAAAYEGGIEVSSINPGSLATDRRAVKCDANGTYDEAAWTFTYDRSFETFRAVRIDDLRNGTTYFTGPVPSSNSHTRLLPCTLPAASYHGELVSAGFQGKDIWLYGVPEDLDAVPEPPNASTDNGSNANGLSRGPSVRSSARVQENDSVRVPQWQILCDKLRNTFVAGSKIGELEGVNTVKFVADFADSNLKERLLVAARGVSPNISMTDEEAIDFVDGGRITILDFDYGVTDGTTTERTIEVGTGEAPEVLEEEHRDMATEVAIVRRRTVAQNRRSRGGAAAVMRSMTTANRPPPLPTQSSSQTEADEDDPLVPRRIGAAPVREARQAAAASDETETQSIEEQEALDAPYAHASPRSGTTLRRAATAAANTRRLHPSAAANGHIVYRRADGRAEHPHESDADNWVPPPPPYQKEDPGDLPSFLRHSAIPALLNQASGSVGQQAEQGSDRKAIRNSSASMHHQQHRRAHTATSANRYSSPVPPVPPLPSVSNVPPVPPVPPLPPGLAGSPLPPVPPLPHAQSHQRVGSSGAPSNIEDAARPASRSSRYLEGENIYDVSPPDSPALAPVGQQVSQDPTYPEQLARTSTASSTLPPTTARAQTDPVSPEDGHPAALDVQAAVRAAAQTTSNLVPPSNEPAATDPLVRRISVSRTWPIQPVPINTNTAPTGYPYSAPPVNMTANEALSRGISLAQGGESNLNITGHRTSYQRPISQQQHYSFPRPRPHNSMITPVGDMPLIISTPKGVSGAFDPPERHPSQSRAETPILMPIPRHPRPQTQASILRPQDQQQQQQQQQPGAMYGGGDGPFMGPLPPLPPVPPESTSSFSTGGLSRRLPSLGRRQSRAERSAARNVADAKRRGWTSRQPSTSRRSKSTRRGGKGGNKGQKKKGGGADFDAASSAAWTDVTVEAYSVRDALGMRGKGGRTGTGHGGAGLPGKDKKGRCVVIASGTCGGVRVFCAGGPSVAAMGLPRLEFVAISCWQASLGSKKSAKTPKFAAAITVSLDPSRGTAAELQQAAIDRVQEWIGLGKRNLQRPVHDQDRDAAVILASRSLAPWLDDNVFLSRLLAASGMADVEPSNVSVLTAAVDEVPRYDRRLDYFASSEGISILRGHKRRILPSLHFSTATSASPSLPSDQQPASPSPFRVHVPLANTLFANGRQNTMSASQWWFPNQLHIGSQLPVLKQKVHLTNQTVILPPNDLGFTPGSGTGVSGRIIPVTPARRVVGSMGNILSKIEINGEPAPASQELEHIVHLLLKPPRKLREDNHGSDHTTRGPLDVWAMIIPPEHVESDRVTPPLPLDEYHPNREWRLARHCSNAVALHLAYGCRLHRVLSGGGGWGAKQGLLSLDSQVAPVTDEDKDLQSFIDSFRGGAAGGGRGGIVPAGSYVQFFVEGAYPRPEQYMRPQHRRFDPEDRPRSLTTVFGTPGAVIGASPLEAVRPFHGLFGAISSEGVFVTGRKKAEDERITFKLDTPRSYVVSRGKAYFGLPPPQSQELPPQHSTLEPRSYQARPSASHSQPSRTSHREGDGTRGGRRPELRSSKSANPRPSNSRRRNAANEENTLTKEPGLREGV
ncbi:hypothetical protein P885DRAFT_29485 [Corynascus similis CBS 632.67]